MPVHQPPTENLAVIIHKSVVSVVTPNGLHQTIIGYVHAPNPACFRTCVCRYNLRDLVNSRTPTRMAKNLVQKKSELLVIRAETDKPHSSRCSIFELNKTFHWFRQQYRREREAAQRQYRQMAS